MSGSGSQFLQGQDDQELVAFGGLPCRRPVQEAFEQHGMDSTEAMVVLREWTDLGALANEGVLTVSGSIGKDGRTVAWEAHHDWVILTITNRNSEPATYSLEWRVRESADGARGTYVHAFWLGGAGLRLSS